VHGVEDSKSVDDFEILSMVQDFQLRANGFVINSFDLKWISQRMKLKVTAKREGKRVRVPGIPEFITTAGSEASDAKSPRFKDVARAEIPRDAPGGVGMTPMEEVEVEKEEEKDHDVHFQRK